ncbi:MAG: 2-(1,2-epoxy-1,2-dihydrophenyl)acetyl-CoA isomerase [Methylobacteriaceae bacterium]|nr:2-(1,2-epoxy-1,2-dihydrophenyl)acetyl-CoA isomerase [Methylobacteriaceae bacterium]
MSEQPVLVEARPTYRVITLNRPSRLNAVTIDLHRALADALDKAEADKSCRSILITGAGRGFCAGQDLSDIDPPTADKPADLGLLIDRHYNPLIRRLRAFPMPVVCAVNGIAAGAGANIALACDIVIAARSASFLQAFAKIGLVPDSGGTFFLPRLIGEARARALCLTAEPISAETAADWGLIWKCVDDAELLNEAQSLCERFGEAPTRSLAVIKRSLDKSAQNTLDAQLDLERDLQREIGRGSDYVEGVTAFLQKRKPAYKGRA